MPPGVSHASKTGQPDAMPAGDLVLRRTAAAAERLLSVRELEDRARAWRPWRGYAVMHLWLAALPKASPARRAVRGAHDVLA